MPVQDRPSSIPAATPSQNLWNKALDTLGVELRSSLDLTQASRISVLSKVLKEAQEKKRVCAQKCWTLKKCNGEFIILRDLVEKIVVWVEKFIAVGDAAVQYDPVHAALAWGAFRFVLQIAVNDKRAFGETVENLEAVSHLITRYAILEELYLQRKSEASDKLEDMIIRLYAEILTFLAKARKFFQSSAKIRLAMSMVKLSEDEHMAKINILDGQISKLTKVFTVDIQIDTAKGVAAMNALLTSLNEPIKRLADHSTISAQVLEESQRLQILHWLSAVPFSSHHKRHSESRIPGSGQWLLNHDQYLNWRNTSSSSIFMLHGIMGCGKTSLASAVVDSVLQESSGQASPAPIAYFYCTKNSAETERSNPDEIMRSILRQLTVSHGSSSTIHQRVLQEYQRRQEVAKVDGFEMTRLQAAECVRLILDTTAANPAIIILDAVDEIQSSSRHVLLSALIQIVQGSLSVVKVFVTSRDDSNVHALLSGAVTLRIQNEHTRKDMDEFVHQEISSAIQNRRMLNGVVSDHLKRDLTSVLRAGAGEMFIWVARQIENLCRMKTEADIKTAMRALPNNTLNELYEEDFTRMTQAGQYTRDYATQVFSMLLSAQEALSPEALIQATAKIISQDGETMTLVKMIDICFNLIVLDSELKVLRFAHTSIQEFLERRAEFAPHFVHKVAATSCLESCLEGISGRMETDLSPKDNFYHYSSVYWAEHCRLTLQSKADDSITGKVQEFVFDGGDAALSFVDWIEEVNKFTKRLPNDHALVKELNAVIHSGGSPLFTACVFGLASIIDKLADASDYDWNQTNDLGHTGLYLAAAFGHRMIVQGLLQHEVDVNSFGGKFDHPLHAACFHGHASVARLLLDHGADPKMGPRSALEYALLADHEHIALLLLDGKFDISDQAEYDSILQQAAEAGFADMIQVLQKKYASLYGDLGSSRCRAVELAIFKGRTGVVERYMQKLSNPSIEMLQDAIATAALGGQDTMISLLVNQGLDLNEEGVLGTPLRAASIMCHESTVRLLLRLGASLHVSGSFGEPLQAAAMRGHESITRTLLTNGADVNSKGGLYGTALQAAAHRGHQKVVEILLDAGACVYQDGFSRDALHAASEGGHEGIVRLFLERGFTVRHELPHRGIRCRKGERSPYKDLLREASPSRHLQTKPTKDHLLVSKDWRERASMIDFARVVEKVRGAISPELELIEPYRERLEYEPRGEKNYALRAAAAKGHTNVVKLLLSQIHAIGISKYGIDAAFIEACKHGHERVVSLLLSDEVEVTVLKAALDVAALEGHLTVVNLLIDHEDRLGLAQVERVQISRPAAKGSNLDIDDEAESISLDEPYECDAITRAILLSSVSKGGHLPVFKRGQDLVDERCTDFASRHVYREALTIAARSCNVDIMEALFVSHSEFDLEELTQTLDSICASGSEEILQIFLKQDATKMLGIQQYSSGLSQAARNNNRQVVAYWLEEHPEHNNMVIDPATVISVSRNGFMDILPPLIQQIRPTDFFEKALSQCLQVASRNGHKEVVEYLIGEGADVNAIVEEVVYTGGKNGAYDKGGSTRKLSALQAALIGFERFEVFTRYGYLLDPPQSWTEADASSQQRSIEILLAKGADPNRVGGYERYPLNIAAEYCAVEIVQALLSFGAHAKAATKEHGTALLAAAGREVGGLPIINAILEADAPASPVDPGKAAALNQALSFFDGFSGRFEISTSITDVLRTGPGAVVKFLLANLPHEKADDSRYCLLSQMACMAGDQGCIELLLQRGIDVNASGYYYGSALQAACRVGNIKIVERLLDAGADINILQGAHGTSLRAAVIGGHEDLVRSLIARGAEVNLRHNHDVLQLALHSRTQAMFKALLAAGADMNTETSDQPHILIAACKHGDATLVGLLLASGVDVNVSRTRDTYWIPDDEATPLNAACAEGHVSVVRLLVDHGADIEKTNASCVTPLMAAIRGNNISVIQLLLDAGANVNHAVRATPLSQAAEDCKLEIVEELLSAGAIIGEALSAAMKGGNDEIACLLLEHVTSPSFEMLRQACSAGVLEAVRLLVDKGIDVNEDDGNDAPLLHIAASHSRPDTVQFLIDRGASVMLRSPTYGSPLIAALEGTMAPFLRSWSQPESCLYLAKQLPLPGSFSDDDMLFEYDMESLGGTETQKKPGYKEISQCEQIVRSLLDAGAEMDTTIRSFGNALHLASYMGSEFIVRQFLERMEDVNIFGGYFDSPLIAALKGDHPTIVRLLVGRRVEVNHLSPEHGFALHYACAHSSKKSIQILLDHGADINAYDEKHGSALATAAFPGTRFLEEQCAKVELLLRHNPKVQIRECDLLAAASWTYSARYEPFESRLVNTLIEHGKTANFTAKVREALDEKFQGERFKETRELFYRLETRDM